LRVKFSRLNVNLSTFSPHSLGLKKTAHASVKEGYPPKNPLFYGFGTFSLKTVADRHRRAAYRNKNCCQAFKELQR